MSQSYTTDEIAQLLKVSKLTVYNLIKKGDLPAFRVGRQMRVDAIDLERFKAKGKEVEPSPSTTDNKEKRPIVISGQDTSLDILARTLEVRATNIRPLRSYVGSLDSLMAMYAGKADIVSTHLFDGDTNEYNVPYIRKLLVSKSFVVIRFITREAGLYVAKGNPKDVHSWEDLKKSVTIINREPGAGARILLDEQLRIHGIKKREIQGYTIEETSHLAVASAIANGRADIGIGIEQIAHMATIDFVPLITENYDLVMLKTENNRDLINHVQSILRSSDFQDELQSLGYETKDIGDIIWEQ